MDLTLRQMTEQVIATLNQNITTRPRHATFTSFTGPGADGNYDITVSLLSANAFQGGGLFEVGHELLEVFNFDPTTQVGKVPPWGRAQLGSAEYTGVSGDKVTINPLWPFWIVCCKVIDGIAALSPTLFQVKNTTLETVNLAEKYELPDDCDQIQDLRIEYFGAPEHEERLTRYSVDTSNVDGNRYLHIPTRNWGGRPIRLTYRAKPSLPADPTEADTWSFADSGLPTTASDLPILHATGMLLPSAEAAKTQNSSAEQSDRNRYVQTGTATAASRRFMDLFEARLNEERRNLYALYPPDIHHRFNS